jgi:5-(carboxyamino)imidazole ribonucleotide mutase
VAVNGSLNAAMLAIEMLALSDTSVAARLDEYKKSLANKIVKANEELAEVKYKFKTN